jgi:hypothetical protein
VEADGQEQQQGQRDAAGRRGLRPESEQGADADRQLAEGDEDAERDRDVGQRGDQGVDGAAAASWDWIEAGSAASKNFGLASFCRPAKQNVNPRKARSGSSTRPSAGPVTPAGSAGIRSDVT